jgi:hypothetical protein
MSVEFDMRAADSSPLGKLTHAIKTDVPEETGELLGFLAAAHRRTRPRESRGRQDEGLPLAAQFGIGPP